MERKVTYLLDDSWRFGTIIAVVPNDTYYALAIVIDRDDKSYKIVHLDQLKEPVTS